MSEKYPSNDPERERVVVHAGDTVKLFPQHGNRHNIAVITSPDKNGFFLGSSEVEPGVFRGAGTNSIDWVATVTAKNRFSFDELVLVYAQAVTQQANPPEAILATARKNLLTGEL